MMQYCVWTVSAVVGINAQLDDTYVGDVIECEEKIVYQSEALLSVGSKEQIRHEVSKLNKLLQPLGLETSLVVIRPANSLALFFICMTLSALMTLRDQWRSQELRDIVESLFTFLSGAEETVRVRKLTWPLTHYERCLHCFNSSQGTPTNLNFLHICGLRMC